MFCVTNNGYHSEFFQVSQGIRQGCPLSALLFVLVVEIMAANIRNNHNIKGIKVGEAEIKISQLADDTSLFLQDLQSVKHATDFLREFGEISGLKLNCSKTEAIWIGSNIGRSDKPLGIKWIEGTFKCLGVWCSNNTDEMITKNYRERINKIKQVLNIWQCRNLSLKGKVTVIWSVALPQLLYICSCLYTPQWVINEVDKILFAFLWGGKKAHVKKRTIISTTTEGGLKMVHFASMVTALKINWIKRLSTMSSNCSCLASYFIDSLMPIALFFKCKMDVNLLNNTNLFYHQILKYWFDLYPGETECTDTSNEILWYNRDIRIDNRIVFLKKWWEKGIYRLNHVINNNGTPKPKLDIESTFDIKINIMHYNSLIHAIPQALKQKCTNQAANELDHKIKLGKLIVNLPNLRCKDVYKYLVSKVCSPPTCINKWAEIYNTADNIWEGVFELPYKVCTETQLQSFQFKIIHRFFPCNYSLALWYEDVSNICQYCTKDVDTLEHYFMQCPDVKIFWSRLMQLWENTYGFSFALSKLDILFGIINENDDVVIDALNYCILVGKWYIYFVKYSSKKISFLHYLHLLKTKLQVLELIYCLKDKKDLFTDKWSMVYNSIQQYTF